MIASDKPYPQQGTFLNSPNKYQPIVRSGYPKNWGCTGGANPFSGGAVWGSLASPITNEPHLNLLSGPSVRRLVLLLAAALFSGCYGSRRPVEKVAHPRCILQCVKSALYPLHRPDGETAKQLTKLYQESLEGRECCTSEHILGRLYVAPCDTVRDAAGIYVKMETEHDVIRLSVREKLFNNLLEALKEAGGVTDD